MLIPKFSWVCDILLWILKVLNSDCHIISKMRRLSVTYHLNKAKGTINLEIELAAAGSIFPAWASVSLVPTTKVDCWSEMHPTCGSTWQKSRATRSQSKMNVGSFMALPYWQFSKKIQIQRSKNRFIALMHSTNYCDESSGVLDLRAHEQISLNKS